MLLTELDGLLTGVLVCPEPIAAEEWLPVVLGDETDGVPPFEDPLDVRWFRDAVVARRDEIARDLGRGRLQPILDVDERNGDVLWEPWIDGFAEAVALRPEVCSALASGGDADAAEAVAFLRADRGRPRRERARHTRDQRAGRERAFRARRRRRAPPSGEREASRNRRADPGGTLEGGPERSVSVRIGEEGEALLRVTAAPASTRRPAGPHAAPRQSATSTGCVTVMLGRAEARSRAAMPNALQWSEAMCAWTAASSTWSSSNTKRRSPSTSRHTS